MWKERLKISKLDKSESDISEASEDIALQSCEILQTGGGGADLSPTIQTSGKIPRRLLGQSLRNK